MGAGSTEEHHMQDTGECYWVYIVQKEFEARNIAHLGTVDGKKAEYNNYCSKKNITESFKKSPYKKNMDLALMEFVDKLVERFPGKKMNITDVEKEYRNKGLKGDFTISFNDPSAKISFSLKNYKKGFNKIQLCSCTWNSFLNKLVLNSAGGPGQYIDCGSGEPFQAQRDLTKRDNNYKKLGHEDMLEDVHYFDDIHEMIKQKWVYSEERNFLTPEVYKEWKLDLKLGNEAIEKMIIAMDKLEKKDIQEKIMKMAGWYYEESYSEVEELLLIGKEGTMMCSLFNVKYNELLERLNNEESCLSYRKWRKNIRFSIRDSKGEMITFDVPFCLNRNGAYVTGDRYEGTKYHKKEKKELKYLERRPKKSKEIATSTNLYCPLTKFI